MKNLFAIAMLVIFICPIQSQNTSTISETMEYKKSGEINQNEIIKNIVFHIPKNEQFNGNFKKSPGNFKDVTKYDDYYFLISKPRMLDDYRVEFIVLNFDVQDGDRDKANKIWTTDKTEFFKLNLRKEFPTIESHTDRPYKLKIETWVYDE